jgi:hypothetical protein
MREQTRKQIAMALLDLIDFLEKALFKSLILTLIISLII